MKMIMVVFVGQGCRTAKIKLFNYTYIYIIGKAKALKIVSDTYVLLLVEIILIIIIVTNIFRWVSLNNNNFEKRQSLKKS